MTKYLPRSNVRGKRFALAHRFRLCNLSWRQGREASGHMESLVGTQSSECWCSAHCLLLVLWGLQAVLLPTFRVGLPQRAFLGTRGYVSTVLLASGILTVHTGSSLCNVQVPHQRTPVFLHLHNDSKDPVCKHRFVLKRWVTAIVGIW